MTFYRLSWSKNINKLINVNTVSSFYQHKNRLTITYNYSLSNAFLIFGTGVIEQTPHQETFDFDNEQTLTNEMEKLEKITNCIHKNI